MTNADLFRLHAGLKACGDLTGAKFAYAIAKNLRIVGAECDALKASTKPSPEFLAYRAAAEKLGREYAELDDDGQPVVTVEGDQAQMKLADPEAFRLAEEPLRKEHAEAIAEHEAKVAEFEKLLDEEAEIKPSELYTVPMSIFPNDISAEQLDGIFEIVDEGGG